MKNWKREEAIFSLPQLLPAAENEPKACLFINLQIHINKLHFHFPITRNTNMHNICMDEQEVSSQDSLTSFTVKIRFRLYHHNHGSFLRCPPL